MKNLFKINSLGLVAATLLFATSCDDTDELTAGGEETEVSLAITDQISDDVDVFVADLDGATSFTANVQFTSSNDDMKRLYMTQNVQGAGNEIYKVDLNVDFKADESVDLENSLSGTFNFDIPFPVDQSITEGTVVYELWATSGLGDHRDQSKRLTVGIGTITVDYDGDNPATPVKEFTATILEAPLSSGESSTFVSLIDGEVYQIVDGEEYVSFWDFGYYYTGDDGASLASTADYENSFEFVNVDGFAGDEDLNNAYFKNTTVGANIVFDDVTVSGDLDGIISSGVETLNFLEEGQVIEFVDNYGKKGVLEVIDIVPGDGSLAEITIDIKVQP